MSMSSKKIQVLEIELNEPVSASRTDKISRIMKTAGNFKAHCKYREENENYAVLGFVSDNIEVLEVMLQNN